MRPISSKLILVVLMALGGSSAAFAEDISPAGELDSESLAIMTDLQLDQAFETAMAKAGERSLLTVDGPTSMLCQTGVPIGSAETCVVTAPARGTVVPAALAQR